MSRIALLHVAVLSAALVFRAAPARAFSPPADRQEGVTLAIEGFAEAPGADRDTVQERPTDQPLAFTVTLKNESGHPVSGTLRVWLNDDWQVAGDAAVPAAAAPGQTWQAAFTATARDRVLNALYPIHARLDLTLAGKAVTLHPVALFSARKPASAASAAFAETVLAPGLLRLDSGASRRTFVSQKGAVTELGVNYSAADPATGTHMSRDTATRLGVSRAGFTLHPPYRNGPGATWNDFRLTFPAGQPAALRFHTALRDHSATEPASDGAEFKVFALGADNAPKELFSRFSDSKAWEPASVDLSAYAGQTVTLRLWTGPGPKGNTTCDQCFWGDPVIAVGALPALSTEAQWQDREAVALAAARLALAERPRRGSGAFRLEARGQRFGAAVALGPQGLTDAAIAFTDGSRALTYRGFACDIDRAAVGGVENGQPVLRAEAAADGDAFVVTHHVAGPGGAPLQARAALRADRGALRLAWSLPPPAPAQAAPAPAPVQAAPAPAQAAPRFTRLGIGPGSLPVWRAYAGFGNVIENPGAFDLSGGGFTLSTRHVGADHTNGLSLVQACDVFPNRLTHAPAAGRFALETAHDATFFLIPSASGAFDAARTYRDLCGFQKGPGVKAVLGRMCLDQWGGDYLEAADGLAEAGRYGLSHAVFVKHVWQRWGYDYRLPEIYPPANGLEPFLALRQAAAKAGMLFCPHDNYIDFYPDAEGYSYDHIVFTESGAPMRAWFNKGRKAQSYRWLPHAFRPWLEANMRLMRDGFAPDSLFIDVFTAIAPFDYYDRAGAFYPRTRTAQEWRDAFDTCRKILKRGAPMISEAGTDALIGSLDAGQADHFPAARWLKEFSDADRTPWHDMASHGKMVLFAGGLGPRYSAFDWEDHAGKPLHGYGSDDYLSNTVLGGRNPMCDGPFSRRAVMTYWLLHDVCDALARAEFESHAFGATVRQQHTAFSDGSQAWANRGSNLVWTVADGTRALPEYGFYVTTPEAEAGVVLLGGQRAGFARSEETFFADARPVHSPLRKMRVESSVAGARYLGNGAFELTFNWNVLDTSLDGYAPFIHVCSDTAKSGNTEKIAFQAEMRFDRALLLRPGPFTATARLAVPPELPAGAYTVRYGLYRPSHGDRLAIRGLSDGGSRICGGTLKVEKAGGAFTAGTYTPETSAADDTALGLNVERRMLDFGPLVTDGAFRLLHDSRHAWQLLPLPGSNPFRAELRLERLGQGRAKVKAVTRVDPFNPAAQEPEWTQDGALLRLSCDGQSFAYRIEF